MAVRILVVEDSVVISKGIQKRVINLGYEIAEIAHEGEEAVKKATDVLPDLVLMDIRLKGDMDGIEAAELIQKNLYIPVIFLTAYADDDTLNRAKITEPYGYLLKPFNERELQIVIEIAMYRNKMQQEKDRLLKEKEELIQKLQKSFEEIKVLQGIIPICVNCKKIRDDDGFWQNVADYISEHSEAEFTHGLCPHCAKELYGDFYTGD